MAGTAAKTKTVVTLIVGIVMGGCLVALAGNSTVKTPLSKHYRAWVEREKLDYPTVAPYAAQVGGDAFLKSERWKNAQKDDLVEVRDVVYVSVNKTSDGGELTITLVDVDGKESTLWLSGTKADGGKVRSISPY
jgi:hypothetical protein